MRHRKSGQHFNRDTNHRKALFRNLVRSLVEHGEITTTEAKAKATKKIADRLISKAKQDDINTRRQLHRFFGKRDIVNTLVEKIAPAMGKRISGFSTLSRIGKRRGDNVEMVKLSLVKQPKAIGSLKSGIDHSKKRPAKKKTVKKKPAKKKSTAKKKTASKKKPAKKAKK
jgi:large subunit ribosomal protein L17